MPTDDRDDAPGRTPKVAEFIHEAFYSKNRQARNKPPPDELSRLTVGQYRNVLASLIGSFRNPGGGWGRLRGAQGGISTPVTFRR